MSAFESIDESLNPLYEGIWGLGLVDNSIPMHDLAGEMADAVVDVVVWVLK